MSLFFFNILEFYRKHSLTNVLLPFCLRRNRPFTGRKKLAFFRWKVPFFSEKCPLVWQKKAVLREGIKWAFFRLKGPFLKFKSAPFYVCSTRFGQLSDQMSDVSSGTETNLYCRRKCRKKKGKHRNLQPLWAKLKPVFHNAKRWDNHFLSCSPSLRYICSKSRVK